MIYDYRSYASHDLPTKPYHSQQIISINEDALLSKLDFRHPCVTHVIMINGILCILEQVLVDENKVLRQEIKRLKEDNARLIRQTKQAMAERDQVLVCILSFLTTKKTGHGRKRSGSSMSLYMHMQFFVCVVV